MSKKYYWLKLEKDFFKRHDIRIVESMPNGKDYVLFYLKLILESMNHEGRLRFSETIPYNDDMLATITNTNVDVVRSAVKVFTELGLMEVWDDRTIYLAETNKMVGVETEWAKKKREYKKRMEVDVTPLELPNTYPYKLGECTVHNQEQIELPNGTMRYVDEKRYGGNGKIVIAKSGGKCEVCGDEDSKLLIHHKKGYSNNVDDLVVLCSSCHGKEHAGGKSPRDFLRLSDKSKSLELEKELDIEIDKELDKYDYKSVIDHLNLKTGKNFKNVEGNKKFVRARYKEGYELEDFKTVIDNMVTEWAGTEWYNNGKLVMGDSLLRPQTLFGNKFDSYLNKEVKKKEMSDIIEYS